MKVLHILNELKFSGAEIMYVAAAEEFRALECELYVVNTAVNLGEYATFFEQSKYTVLHWPYTSTKGILRYIKNTIRFLKENKIDVVHIHASSMRLLMSYCAWRAGCKSVYTFHSVFKSNWYSYIYHILQRKLVKKIFGTKFQTISDSVYKHEKKHYFNKTNLVYNWYNTEAFYPAIQEEKSKVRLDLKISDDTLVLISIGGCNHIKRHKDIIQALSLLARFNSNFLYLHLGEGSCTEHEIHYSKMLQLDDKVRFIGNKRDVRNYLIASDLYLMTSKIEGISLTTIEAMACKIPAILYNVPGLRDFNNEKECSLLVKESPGFLSEGIITLSNDSSKIKAISESAFSYVKKKFDMKRNVMKIYSLYR